MVDLEIDVLAVLAPTSGIITITRKRKEEVMNNMFKKAYILV